MFNISNKVFVIYTNGPNQKIINKILMKYNSNIEYIQSSYDSIYVVFRNNDKGYKTELSNIDNITNVEIDKTLFGRLIEQFIGKKYYQKLNPTVTISN